MRRTQQNADRQRRRGVRSRLVACVAAVAMLVTSVAAGTAVAAELGGSDAADQTTQNTATLEQQGTGNTGDGDQITANGDGQADGNQSSDAGNAAEGDEGTVDGGAVDGAGVDDGQTPDAAASKNVEETPAPQSADDGDTNDGVAALASDDGGAITVNMFDYTCRDKSGNDACSVSPGSFKHSHWQTGDFEAYTSGINKNHDFKFLYGYNNESAYLEQSEQNRPDTWNVWTDTLGGKYKDSRYPRIVQDELQNGSPVLNVGNKKSLAYLFDPAVAKKGQNGVTDVRTGVQGLITRGNDGYYEYDSDKNSATLFGNNVQLGRWTGKFMPFGSSDQYFGMTVESQFYMPEGGMVDGKPMKFEFSGDDDVWVFIGGKLVLDLGGIHDKVSGSIDFSTGDVVTQDNNGQQTSKDDLSGTFGSDWKSKLSGQRHTLKMFYLERGGDASNCKIRFNMPQVPSDRISIAKQVTGAATEEDLSREYHFKVYVDSDGNSNQPESVYMGKYTVNGVSHDTDENGVISVPANGMATLTEDFEHGSGATYRVVELSDSIDGFEVSAMDADGETLEVTSDDEGITTGSVAVSESPLVTVRNNKSLGEPAHRKYITKKDGANDEYTLRLSVTGHGSSNEGTPDQPADVDVVFVLDKSPSMGGCLGSEDSSSSCKWGISRLKAMKTAAENLVDTVSHNKAINARFGIVTFHGSASMQPIGYGSDSQYLSSDSEKVKEAIKNISTWGASGTNWNVGLSQVKEYETRDGAQKYVVFLTDGVPNRDEEKDDVTGGSLVEDGWNVLNVGVDLRRYTSNLDELTESEQREAADGQTVLQFNSEDESGDLNAIFEQIAGIIGTPGSSSWQTSAVITDVISAWAEPVGIKTDEDQPTVVTDGVKVFRGDDQTNNLANDPNVIESITLDGKMLTVTFTDRYRLPDGETITVVFDVKPSEQAYRTFAGNQAAGKTDDDLYQHVQDSHTFVDRGGELTGTDSAGKAGFYSNDSATLAYTQCTQVGNEQAECDEKTPLEYAKPVLQVKTTSVDVSKSWTDGNENHVSDSVEVSISGDDVSRPALTLNANNGWKGTFTGLIPGHTYTVTETAVDGYETSYSYTVGEDSSEDGIAVSVEDVWKDNPTEFAVTVTNTLKTNVYDVDEHLNLRKVLTNGSLSKGDFDFTLTVEYPADKSGITLYDMDGNPIQAAGGSLTETVSNGNGIESDDASVVEFGKIEFTEPGVYMVSVREPEEKRQEGINYDEHTLYVLYVLDESMNRTRYIHSEDSDMMPLAPTDPDAVDMDVWTEADGKSFSNESLTWRNTITVSALPLTGGDSTARSLLLAGGGVLLVAGVAWLLARRRRV